MRERCRKSDSQRDKESKRQSESERERERDRARERKKRLIEMVCASLGLEVTPSFLLVDPIFQVRTVDL